MHPPSLTLAGLPAAAAFVAMHPHFVEKFCACAGLRRNDYHDVVFERVRPAHARLLQPLLERIDPYFFAPDHDFIVEIGRTTRREDFVEAVRTFEQHPANRHFLRRVLGCRISAERFERVFHQTWALCEGGVFLSPPDTP